jgi:AraC-like DNA-binding protein
MILAQRPLKLPADIRVRRKAAPPLQVDGKCKSNLYLAQYKREAMHAIRFPYLMYVLEGELEMRLGIPARPGKSGDAVTTYQIITLPAQTFLVIPPGVFHPDSDRHNSVRSTSPANLKVFMMRVLPTGGFCHSSSMQNGKFLPDHLDVFVPCFRLALLAEMLMEELQSSGTETLAVAQHTLVALLSRTRRGLSEGVPATLGQDTKEPKTSTPSDALSPGENSVTVDRACDYIRSHLATPFHLEDVASHAYISPSHLTRLFRVEQKTTVMNYALNQRLQYAQSLLLNSELTVEEIARYIGYSQTPQFNRIFKRIHGVNPTEFRRRHRSKAKLALKAK